MTINKNFVVRNGLEVAQTLLCADDETNRVGINSANPEFNLDLYGDLRITGALSVGGTTGRSGEYLESTGDALEWKAIPVLRVVETYTAVSGQVTFPSTGFLPYAAADFIDVFVDGVKLSQDEYTPSTGNTRIELVAPAFAGETVELVAYNASSIGVGGSGIQGITIGEEGVVVGTAGQVTNLNFVGASLTAIGSGAGVTVYFDNVVPGIATYASFSGVATYASSSGIASALTSTASVNTTGIITASKLVGDGSGLTGISGSKWVTTSVGIHTLSNVGFGTTNPTSALTVQGDVSVSGVSSFQNDIKVAEYSYGTNSNQITLGNNKFRIYADGSNTYLKNYDTNSGGDLYIEADEVFIRKYNGTETIAQFTEGAGVKLNYQDINKFETLGTGVTVTGTTFTNQLSVSGIATIGPVATGTTSLYLGGPLKVGEIDISGGSNSVHVGQGAGRKNYNGGSGQQNTAVGWNALGVNQASNFNTAFGISALGSLGDTAFSNYDANTAIGAYAGSSLLTGINNTFLGRSAGSSITSGSSNTILGMYTGNSGGLDIRTSSNNVVLSDGAGNIRLYANSSGNIGIGTTNATEKLTVRDGDISVGINTSTGLILTSPNGTRYRLIVDDSGNLSTTAV